MHSGCQPNEIRMVSNQKMSKLPTQSSEGNVDVTDKGLVE
jgi:hypothetical protein